MKESYTAAEKYPERKRQRIAVGKSYDEKYEKIRHYSDLELQNYLLVGVSRTFALTIPQLPTKLARIVTNAYLLCRIVDTIEDEPALTSHEKRVFCDRFIEVVAGNQPSSDFARDLVSRLSSASNPDEHLLISVTERVIRITHGFPEPYRKALERCVRIMSDGMAYFQENASINGLKDMGEMNNYCYYVAGVVGEMLTELFCLYSAKVAQNREKMMSLAVSYGQGLQMTNILKDLWDDLDRSACWLPRDVFNEKGFDLVELQYGNSTSTFQSGLKELIGVTHVHLENAMEYTLLIPPDEKGIRKFCLWAIGMAVLTLQNIYRNIDFKDGNEVKISRRSVKATIVTSNLLVKNNTFLKWVFNSIRLGLPYDKSLKREY